MLKHVVGGIDKGEILVVPGLVAIFNRSCLLELALVFVGQLLPLYDSPTCWFGNRFLGQTSCAFFPLK